MWQAMYKDLTCIVPYTNCRSGSRSDFELALEMIAKGKLPSKEMITHRLPLEEIQKGLELMAHKDAGPRKVVQVVIKP